MAAQPVYNNRPHYVRQTREEGVAHLFHIVHEGKGGGLPRWVIGPELGNGSGECAHHMSVHHSHAHDVHWCT